MKHITVFTKGERALPCLMAMENHGFLPSAVFPEDNGSDVMEWCNTKNVTLLNSPDAVLNLDTDLLILAGYSKIIRNPLLSHAKLGTLNLHGGKLPEYRGASVMNWQMINGETKGGIAIIFADEGVDTGDIVAQATYEITKQDTIRDVNAKVFKLFPELLVNTLKKIQNGTVQRIEQNPLEGAFYHKRTAEDGLLLWDRLSAEKAHNFVRALTRPYPGAFTWMNGKKITIWETSLITETYRGAPGRLVRFLNGSPLVIASDQGLVIRDFNVEDFTRQDSIAFLKKCTGKNFSNH